MLSRSYELKKGVFLHAFFDDSGVVFYDSKTDNTVFVNLSMGKLEDVLQSQRQPQDSQQQKLLQDLLSHNMITLLDN